MKPGAHSRMRPGSDATKNAEQMVSAERDKLFAAVHNSNVR